MCRRRVAALVHSADLVLLCTWFLCTAHPLQHYYTLCQGSVTRAHMPMFIVWHLDWIWVKGKETKCHMRSKEGKYRLNFNILSWNGSADSHCFLGFLFVPWAHRWLGPLLSWPGPSPPWGCCWSHYPHPLCHVHITAVSSYLSTKDNVQHGLGGQAGSQILISLPCHPGLLCAGIDLMVAFIHSCLVPKMPAGRKQQ